MGDYDTASDVAEQDAGANPPPAEEGDGTVECPGPHCEEEAAAEEEPAAGEYPLDPATAESVHEPSQGKFHRFALPSPNSNSTDRPIPPDHIQRDRTNLVEFPGAQGTGLVHRAVLDPLRRMLDAMHAEGERIDDQSLKDAYVHSPWRDPRSEGRGYLRALRNHLGLHSACHAGGSGCTAGERHNGYTASRHHCPAGFQSCRFPSALEAEAQSELGRSGSAAHDTFRDNLAAASGWNAEYARYLLRQTGRFKAPAGGTPHHSGLVVDINFQYADARGRVQRHDQSSARNDQARRSAAGVWINRYARQFGFSSYNEDDEIWHMEWLEWRGTEADPG